MFASTKFLLLILALINPTYANIFKGSCEGEGRHAVPQDNGVLCGASTDCESGYCRSKHQCELKYMSLSPCPLPYECASADECAFCEAKKEDDEDCEVDDDCISGYCRFVQFALKNWKGICRPGETPEAEKVHCAGRSNTQFCDCKMDCSSVNAFCDCDDGDACCSRYDAFLDAMKGTYEYVKHEPDVEPEEEVEEYKIVTIAKAVYDAIM